MREARTSAPLWMLYPLFFTAVYLSHLTLLRLPYFWDEGGYYIPAAWDFFRSGTLVPITTVSSGHPPLPSILLAGCTASRISPDLTSAFMALWSGYKRAVHLKMSQHACE